MFAGAEVHGSTLGILGMGRIGQGIARRGAHGFGMQVIYHNRSRLAPELEAECKARHVGKDVLLAHADHLVLAALQPRVHHAIGAAELARMKPLATLVNIARGGIVDEAALAQALKEGASPPPAWMCSRASPPCTPACSVLQRGAHPRISPAPPYHAPGHGAAGGDNLVAFFDGRGALTPVNTPISNKQNRL